MLFLSIFFSLVDQMIVIDDCRLKAYNRTFLYYCYVHSFVSFLFHLIYPSILLDHLSFPFALSSAFCCHESGATVLAMAPRQQLLITGGKKGWISILGLPHKLQRHSFQAHDSPVKALAVDSTEDCFISGSSEGNIRVCVTFIVLLLKAISSN